jgi:Domain of unknown function (DUF6766)
MGRSLRDYSLSLTLGVFFIASWLLQTLGGWREFAADQAAQGQVAAFGGDEGYVWTWIEATFENWQSEFLQLFTFVVLTVFLIHRESHESRDGQDRMAAQLEEVLERVRALEGEATDGRVWRPPAPASLEESPPSALSTARGALVYFTGVLTLGLVLNLGLLVVLAG